MRPWYRNDKLVLVIMCLAIFVGVVSAILGIIFRDPRYVIGLMVPVVVAEVLGKSRNGI